jgi:hypothetical protein
MINYAEFLSQFSSALLRKLCQTNNKQLARRQSSYRWGDKAAPERATASADHSKDGAMRYWFNTLAGSLVVALAAMSFAAAAEPIKLKFSYYTSDREAVYLSAVKPFIDSVNAAANGLIEIDAFTSGSLGKSYAAKRNWFWMVGPILPLSTRV